MSEWIKTSDELPITGVPVWAYEGSQPYLAELDHIDEGLAWVRVYGEPYMVDGTWYSPDTEYDDDYNPTHWQYLPEPPHDRA
jgi:hypothetical protein